MNKIIVFAFLMSILQCCASKSGGNSDEVEGFEEMADKLADSYEKMPFFPAETLSVDNSYAVQITATTGAFFMRQFDDESLYGNGYCWAGVIEQMLEQKNPALLSKVKFDPEADTCFMPCVDEESMNELAKTINEYCSTREKFQEVLRSVDKGKLDC